MTMMTTKKKTKRSNRGNGILLLASLLLAASFTNAVEPPGQRRFEPYALLVGTVFYEENGFLVRGANIEVRQKDGKKHWQANTNDEGSFSIRVPAGKAVYVVQAQISGREPDRREVEVKNDERVDIVLHLKGK